MSSPLLPAFLAPLLFGLGTVASKALLADIPPVLLAGLLYLGSGVGLGSVWLWRARAGKSGSPLAAPDAPWLAGAILCGGVAGPVLLMWGLSRTSASTASLLLNLETCFTALLAWTLFRERGTLRLAAGVGLAFAGASVLSWPEGGSWGDARLEGSLLVAAACLAWGFDNNLSQRISGKDPVAIAALKGLIAGVVNTAWAFGMGAAVPDAGHVGKACALGFVSYGLSLVCFILSLRNVGAARTGLYFALAPFVGAAGGLLFLGEPVTGRLLAAAALMAGGVWLGHERR
ncbi:DMT family transporter [bacterium]|nr:MAG: DMT family transporter [bacterium]